MSISLRFPGIGEPAGLRRGTNQPFLQTVLGPHSERRMTLGAISRLTDSSQSMGTTSMLVQAAYQAYTAHVGLCLRPEVLWYAIVSEIGEHIRQHRSQYGELLGSNQADLRISDFNPSALFGRLKKELTTIAGDKLVGLFVPRLTTVDINERLALLAALMKSTGPRQDPTPVTACGIPYIQIDGTGDDWQLLKANVEQFKALFPPLEHYLEVVYDVLHSIECTVKGLEIHLGNFWESLYRNAGDTSTDLVNGWITALFAHQRTDAGASELRPRLLLPDGTRPGMALGQFPTHINSVPLILTRKEVKDTPLHHLIAGVTGMELRLVDGDLPMTTPRLGWGIVKMY